VVVSNPQPDVSTHVSIEQDDSAPGEEPQIRSVARATIPPFSLRVFKLGPREVDGSAPGTFDTGTGTALTRAAFRIQSDMPVVAYQFNPLENVSVFSNDASLLKPVEALIPSTAELSDSYVVLGWPQTIARSSDPATNFDEDLRAFLTLVGTQRETHVRIHTTARVIAGGPVPETEAGGVIEAVLGPFEVLNLETGDFGADFTGTRIAADGPVVVFSGSEASDAPRFDELSERSCCADHLEEQLDPIRTAGQSFIATVSPNRMKALVGAGAEFAEVLPQPEYFRLIAATALGARVQTTLAGHEQLELAEKGSFVDLTSTRDFAIWSDAPVMMMSVSPSQAAASIPTILPGGDPSSLIVPPTEQFRSTYVFLTPDKYSFDFVRIIAEPATKIVFDGEPLETLEGCSSSALELSGGSAAAANELAGEWIVHTCQLSFPIIDSTQTAPQNLRAGRQNDGVHRLAASRPVGVLVDGFDAYVSYAYAGGTELEYIVPE
ncbi:MAG TPA: IgGFc-binding protein, partial [Polyangiaceae bacterium]|nr:IgGFc-binding protein [Polyangiaceae bacterium]